jgi:purine nucleosidase
MSWRSPSGPRVRVVADNDYSGDPDGLFQLVHHALSTSVELTCVIGSHLRPGDPFDSSGVTADNAAAIARAYLAMVDRPDVPVVAGSNVGLSDRTTPIDSAGARAIIAAAHADAPQPLFVCLGAGLTELASAWLLDPTIATSLTAVWIGGAEHASVEGPPGGTPTEYNTAIDPVAAQVVLNDSDLVVWQVPRDAYRQAVESMSVLDRRLVGPVGRRLMGTLDRVAAMAGGAGMSTGETYVLGDSPLVLLTALTSSFQPWPASSESRLLPAPVVADDGSYTGTTMPDRSVRVWTRLDCALMLNDFYAKLGER